MLEEDPSSNAAPSPDAVVPPLNADELKALREVGSEWGEPSNGSGGSLPIDPSLGRQPELSQPSRVSGRESHGSERQNPSQRLVMPVDVEHGRLVLMGARRDQEIWDRYAVLAVGRELTLSGQRDSDRLGVH